MSVLKVFDGTNFIAVGGGPAGADTQIQVNSANVFSASSSLTFTSSNLTVSGAIKVSSAGGTLFVKEGVNACMGTGVLVSGATSINTTAITASSRVFISDQGGGVVANIGALYVSSKSGGSGFTVASVNILDTSSFCWVFFNPA